jgi:histidine triad (HIT) family protein
VRIGKNDWQGDGAGPANNIPEVNRIKSRRGGGEMSMGTDCLFCRIAQGDTSTEFLYETQDLVVFKDIHPHAPVHLLIVPKKHIRSINDLAENDSHILSELIFAAKRMARDKNIHETGYKVIFNVERGGGQVIFHLHMHLIGGWLRA